MNMFAWFNEIPTMTRQNKNKLLRTDRQMDAQTDACTDNIKTVCEGLIMIRRDAFMKHKCQLGSCNLPVKF